MTDIDYSKIEINIPKVIINIIISVYFYVLGIVLIIYSDRVLFDRLSFHDTLYSIILSVLFFVISVFMYNIYRRTNIIPLFIFWIFALTSFFVKGETVFLLSILACLIYAVYSLYLLVVYGIKHKNFVKKYENIINLKKYKANFAAVFFLLLLYYLFLIIYEYYAVYQDFKPIKNDSVYILHLFIPLVIFFFFMIISSIILFEKRYVIVLCSLSEYKQVPLSSLTFLFNNSILDENDMKKWFDDKISIYMKGVFLNTSRKMIIFEDIASDIPLDNKI